jgi:hypothetical protein
VLDAWPSNFLCAAQIVTEEPSENNRGSARKKTNVCSKLGAPGRRRLQSRQIAQGAIFIQSRRGEPAKAEKGKGATIGLCVDSAHKLLISGFCETTIQQVDEMHDR